MLVCCATVSVAAVVQGLIMACERVFLESRHALDRRSGRGEMKSRVMKGLMVCLY